MYRKNILGASLCIIAFFTSLTIAQIITSGNYLKFKFSAMNLPPRDVDGASDPYVKFFTASGNTRHPVWMHYGYTGVIQDNNNPTWSEVFSFSYVNSSKPMWRFMVKDNDPGSFWDDHLGRVDLNVDAYINELTKDNGTRIDQPVQLALTMPAGGILVLTPVYA